jgi:hypothetical protein
VLSPPRLRPSAWSAGAPPLPRPGGVLVGADDRRVDADLPDDLADGVRMLLDQAQDPRPGPVPPPAQQPRVAGLPGAVPPRQVPPGDAGAQLPEDPVEDRAVVPPPLAPPGIRRQPGGDLLPCRVGQLVPPDHPAPPGRRSRPGKAAGKQRSIRQALEHAGQGGGRPARAGRPVILLGAR